MRRGGRALASAATLALLGCSDPTVSIGNETRPIPVDPSTVAINVSPCPDGYEHATICCTGDNGQNARACMRYVDTPFHPCAAGWLTYPNENVCCSLDNPADCITATGLKNADAVIGSGACETPPKCPPGTSPDPWCVGFGCWSYVPGSNGAPATREGFCNDAKTPPSSPDVFSPFMCVAECPPTWLHGYEQDVCCRGEKRGTSTMCFASTRYVPLTKR